MSMPHTCRCGTCGREFGYGLRMDLSNGTGNPFAMLPDQPICCHKCNGNRTQTRMILCPTCGNKRCPKASDHELACTNSNESGQPGSVF